MMLLGPMKTPLPILVGARACSYAPSDVDHLTVLWVYIWTPAPMLQKSPICRSDEPSRTNVRAKSGILAYGNLEVVP